MTEVTRRGMLRALLGAPFLGAVGPAPYVPCGYLDCDILASVNVDFVTLGGQRIEAVTKFDDIEGWVERLVFPPPSSGEKGWIGVRQERLFGEVRVHWREVDRAR